MITRLMTSVALCALTAGGVAHAQDRSALPIPSAPFDGTIAENALDAKPATPRPVRAPQGAPNVFVVMTDDVGFAMTSAFGGPVPTPNYERLAASGQRYNRFHTTGICSPSRAALLTGRNHHNAGVGYLSDVPVGFPGYGGRILPETATIARMLTLNGYSTAMFGKHHNATAIERSEAGPFDSWPTGLGFEYFFGFPHGDSDQFSPILYRGASRVEDANPAGDMLDKRLADDVIRWIHNQKAAAPDKPFFAYLAPGSTHAPHQAPPAYIARFKGRFDQGWDKLRVETWRRQIAMGIIPRGTKLTPRPDGIPAWDSLSPARQAFAARTMEVAAAQMAYQDEQIGRVIDELRRMGLADTTLIALVNGDNGASGEAGPKGTINELRSIQTHDEDPAWLEANTSRLGGPDTYGNYPVGWAWAMNAPLRWTKQFASMLGGVRNGMILSWPGHVAKPGSICGQFSHLVDIAPTVLDAARLPAPETVLGVRQKPIDGQSLLPSLAACDGAKPRTQYFEMGGKVGLYHDGWFLSGDDGRAAWEQEGPGGKRPQMTWTLYDLSKDFSQSTDVAQRNPAKLQELMALWQQEAARNNVLPLDYRRPTDRADRAAFLGGPKRYDYWGKDVSVPAMGASPYLAMRAFTVEAQLVLDKPDASGAVLAWGSRFGGWSLYLDHGKPAFVYARSTDPNEMARVVSATALPKGASTLTLRFRPTGLGQGGVATLSAGGLELAKVSTPAGMLQPSGGGETLDVGRDLGVTVTDYATRQGEIEGDVPHVAITFD